MNFSQKNQPISDAKPLRVVERLLNWQIVLMNIFLLKRICAWLVSIKMWIFFKNSSVWMYIHTDHVYIYTVCSKKCHPLFLSINIYLCINIYFAPFRVTAPALSPIFEAFLIYAFWYDPGRRPISAADDMITGMFLVKKSRKSQCITVMQNPYIVLSQIRMFSSYCFTQTAPKFKKILKHLHLTELGVFFWSWLHKFCTNFFSFQPLWRYYQ